MSAKIAALLEIIAAIVCISHLYHQKKKVDIPTAVLILVCVTIYELENAYKLGFYCTIAAYLLITIYCKQKYGDSLIGATYCMFLALIIMTIVQFFFSLFVDLLFGIGEGERAVITNVLVLGSVIWVIPKLKVHRLRLYVKKWSGFLIVLVAFPICMVYYMQLQQRRFREIQLFLFVFAIPMLVFLLILMAKWLAEQDEKCDVENELKITPNMYEQYDELVNEVKLRQHDFKNHLAAVFAAHYTYKSYDELVKAQAQYSRGLLQENKYNDLLTLGDTVLVGFLYEKFREIEETGTVVEFKIKGSMQGNCIPVHYVVEMMGILLDNASQAVQGTDFRKAIQFDFTEGKEEVCFKISNPFQRVSYDEIEEWFQIGRSTKGKGRGLGLYRIRNLCKEKGCTISCRNNEIEGINRIEFILAIKKADKS